MLAWCKEKGTELVEPSDNLKEAYQKKAGLAIQNIKIAIGTEWQVAASYYAMYFSLYAILMKIGIKSEIHRCTILFMKRYLSEYSTKDEIDIVEQARITTQYYTDKPIDEDLSERIKEEALNIQIKCRHITFTESEINVIRRKFRKVKQAQSR